MKVAAIHDLSGFGRCSLAVIIPTLSSMGIQVCPVPTAVFSTHTGGFGEVVFKDLTDYIIPCYKRYKELKIEFDAVYSGFLASSAQIDGCLEFFGGYKNALKVADPVMGDHGKLYRTYTKELCARMSELVRVADVITPNLTEAAILLGEDFPVSLNHNAAKSWLARLCEHAGTAVITGVPMADGRMCNIGLDRDNGGYWRVNYEYIPVKYPGTGDIFASALTGGLLSGDSLPLAINRATAFTQIAVKTAYGYGSEPRDGVMLESALPWLNSGATLSEYEKL
ncbi:MAG: pyridoxamine kinase [Oscillospiraceae bacterium]|jgi:pyridoxine kinase|nr:pyridoxamine kinase [Oscillospiraceae bacterium]